MKKSIFLFFAAILCATSAWAAKERVYFVNTPGWTKVNVHAWGGTAAGTNWPGTTATKDTWQWNGKDVYYLEAEAGAYKQCIFNNGSVQSADLKWEANNVYWFAKPNDKTSGDNKWIPVEVAQANTTGTKIYFVNKQGWSTVKVYAWGLNVSANANWSGTNMTKEAFQLNGYDVYSYTADKEYDFCIFNNGSSQTSDLYWYQGIDKYYYEGEGWMTQEQIGTPKTYKNIKITATVKSETAPTIWWWGAGDKLADAEKTSGVAWPGVAMTKEGDKYVYTFSDVDDSKGVNYLIVSDGIQGYNQHATDDTSVDFINMLPIVAAEGIGGNWGGENKLTPETQDNGYVAKWTTNLAKGDHDIKVTIDKDGTGNRVWYGSNVITISRAENAKVFNEDANKGSDNGKLVADIAGDYTFTYTYKTQTLTVTYPELPTPEYKDITVTVYAKEIPNIWWWNGGDKCADADDAYDWGTAPAMEAVVIDGNTWYQKTFKDVDVALGGINFKLKSQDQSKESNELQTTEDKCYDARVIATVTETPCGQLPTGETPKVTYNVEVPAGTNTCYIAGDMNGWKFTDEMTKVDDTHYTITIEGATTAHKYKYTSGPDWAWEEVIDGDRTYSPNDVVAAWKAVYDPSAPVYDYYIVGSFNGNDPKKAENGMTLDGTFYKATVTLAAGDNTLKVTKGSWDPTWGYNELGAAYEEVSNPNDGYNNIKITLAAEKTITVIFDATAGKITFEGLTEKVIEYGVTYNVTVPVGTPACYICGAWDWNTFKPMTKVDDTHYTLEIAEATKDHGYKYTCGEGWEFVEKDAEGNDLAGNRTWSENDVVAAWAAPAETHTYTVAGFSALCGSEWDAEDPNNEMTLQDDGTYVWTATGVTLSESVEFKVIEDHNWEKAWPANNYVIEIGEDKANTPGTYDVNIYFNAAEAKADNTTGIYVVLTPATIEITEVYDITITNLETEEVQPGILALMGSESEMLGLELQLFLNDYTKENKEYQLNEASYLTCFAGELTFVSGSMTQADDATSGKTYTGKVIAELQGMYFQFNLTMYKKQLPTETLAITGAELVVDLWNNINVTAVHNASPVIVQFSDFEYVASKEYTYLTLEMGEWVDEDEDGICDNANYIYENISEATVTISGSTFTLKSKFEGAETIYDLTITGTLPLIIGEGDNSSVLALDGQTKNVYVTRSFESSNLYTISLPFAMNKTTMQDIFGSRVELYEYTSLADDNGELVLNFTKVSEPVIEAGKPYLLKPNKDSYGFGLSDVTISSATSSISYSVGPTSIAMESVLSATGKTNGKSQYWLASNNMLYNQSVTFKSLRAIFNVETVGGTTGIRARAAFNENAATGVDNIVVPEGQTIKAIVNGQLVIIRGGEMFNVQGQKL